MKKILLIIAVIAGIFLIVGLATKKIPQPEKISKNITTNLQNNGQ